MTTILQEGDPTLRGTAREVPLETVPSSGLLDILKNMKEALEREPDGVAIAAPQIGVPLRIFLISERINAFDAQETGMASVPELVFINPEITELSNEKSWLEEGCLSVRGEYGEVERATTATIRAYNAKGEQFQMTGSGLLAQIFQHETDHLDGILFIDRARNRASMDAHDHEH